MRDWCFVHASDLGGDPLPRGGGDPVPRGGGVPLARAGGPDQLPARAENPQETWWP